MCSRAWWLAVVSNYQKLGLKTNARHPLWCLESFSFSLCTLGKHPSLGRLLGHQTLHLLHRLLAIIPWLVRGSYFLMPRVSLVTPLLRWAFSAVLSFSSATVSCKWRRWESLFPPQFTFPKKDSGWPHVNEKRHKNSLTLNLSLSLVASEFRSTCNSLVKWWMPLHLEASRYSPEEWVF